MSGSACENVKMSIRQDSPDEETSGPQKKITEKEQLLFLFLKEIEIDMSLFNLT